MFHQKGQALSRERCGGTHAPNTTQLHHWTILMIIMIIRKVVFGNAAVLGTKPYINIWVA